MIEPTLRFPLEGTWLVVNPPGHPPHAYDISRLGPNGRLLRISGLSAIVGRARMTDVYGWDAPIVSPSDGTVISAVDGVDDRTVLRPLVDLPASMVVRPSRAKGDLAQLAGNHVVIRSERLYVVLAHMRRGTVQVASDEVVREGQPLGRVGNSGNTLGPHLHLHVMDGPTFAQARVVPFRVRSFDRWLDGRWVPMRNERLPRRIGRIRVLQDAPDA